jgi:acyl-CoA dehydrogenase
MSRRERASLKDSDGDSRIVLMEFADIEVNVSDTERAARETAHRFAEEVMRPAGRELDRLPAEEVVAEGSILWDVMRQQRELGLAAVSTGNDDLSPLEQVRLRSTVSEEMGWGDAGLAISFGVSGFPAMMAAVGGNRELIEMVAGKVGCWSITEPDHGSDVLDFEGKLSATGTDRGRPNCVARKKGDQYVINGQKSSWVSNGTIAEAAALFCAVDDGDDDVRHAVFVLPLDLAGVSKGKALDKIGQRALNQGEIFFDDVAVPKDFMVVPPEGYQQAVTLVLTNANTGMGTLFAGVARSAFELAFEYAHERKQGGVPIINHQSVKSRIFQMFRQVEAARALNRRVSLSNALNGPRLEYAIATKVTSTQTAFEVASAAFQIFGGNGTSREYPIEKIFRDARASMIEDGCNEVLGMLAATTLSDAYLR